MTLAGERLEMVDRDLVRAGISDERVLEAMRTVPREAFYPHGFEEEAYRGGTLPEWAATALTEPLALALVLQGLRVGPRDSVLEIGTGTGYGAAVLSRMVRNVYSVERRGALCLLARLRLEELGYENVRILHGDGTRGWPDYAPYDAIAVTASGRFVPPALLTQMSVGGRLVMPIGPPIRGQRLIRVTRHRRRGRDVYRPRTIDRGVRFTPLQ